MQELSTCTPPHPLLHAQCKLDRPDAQGPKQIKGKGTMETFLLFPPLVDRTTRRAGNGVQAAQDETARLLPAALHSI
eukprot:1014725-Pelagomonas_calceolata.AAC.6